MNVGQKIRENRERCELTHEQLGAIMSLSSASIMAWENNTSIPTASELKQLSEIFGVRLSSLITDVPAKRKEVKGETWKKVVSAVLQAFSVFALVIGFVMPLILTLVLEKNCFWVCFIFCIIPIGSILFGYLVKVNGKKFIKNIISGFVSAGLLFCFGMMTLMPVDPYDSEVSYDDSLVIKAETTLNIDIPEFETSYLLTWEHGSNLWRGKMHAKCDLTFTNENATSFERTLVTDSKWMDRVPNAILGVFCHPTDYTNTGANDCYVLIYNCDTDEFNTLPTADGNYRMLSIIYDVTYNEMTICDYTVEYFK